MGGSINPQTDDPEFAVTPKREFNFWMDPEASRAVLHAHWPRFVLTTVDISVKTRMEKSLIEQVRKSPTPAAQYVAKYAEANYLWDELAAVAWLDPSIITKSQKLFIDVNLDHGAGYGDTLAWAPGQQPGMGEQLVEVQQDLDKGNSTKNTSNCSCAPLPARTAKEAILSVVAAAPIQPSFSPHGALRPVLLGSLLILFPGFFWRGSSSESPFVLGV